MADTKKNTRSQEKPFDYHASIRRTMENWPPKHKFPVKMDRDLTKVF